MKDLQPLNDNVLLDVTYATGEQKTKTGIIIPNTAKDEPEYAEIVSIGSGVESDDISPGDVVYFKKYTGTEFDFGDKKYLILPYADIMAKIVDLDKI